MKTKLSERVRPDCEAAPWVCREIEQLERELAEAKARAVIPDGWVAVPAEPTAGMIDRVLREGAYHDESKARAVLRSEYMDMLSARPELPNKEPSNVE